MAQHRKLMTKVRTVAEVLRAKVELQRPMPALQRLQAVAKINDLRRQLNHGRPAIQFQKPKEQK
jgi:hypothetical protein